MRPTSSCHERWRCRPLASLLLLAGVSCGSPAPPRAGSGGKPGSGGEGDLPGGGGGPGTGGAPETGGNTVPDGGTSATGGRADGGIVATGGAPATGGTSGTGGTRGSGGVSAAGGARSSGGASSAAGVTGTAGSGGAGSGGTTGPGGAPAGDPCGAGNPAVVPLPTIPATTFAVATYGATGDGKTDDTAALQAALTAAAAAGGGTVVVPAGTFISGPLAIGSSTRLELSAGATLKMLAMATYPSGAPPFITATGSGAHDIAITGAGTIDGQGQDWWDAFASDSSVARPQEVDLEHVTRVQLSGIHLQNSPEEHVWVKNDTDVTITGITIATPGVSGKSPPKNTDGVDVSANGMFFCNNDVACGDDNIAMAGSNLYIGYSTFGVGHGCSIGSITKNGIAHVTVDHLTMNGTTSGIRMKSARDRGGLATDLTYTNITMTNVQNPVYITSYYPTLPTDPTADTAMATTATTPLWQNITFRNFKATGSTNAGILWGLPEARISTLVFDGVQIQAQTGMEIFHASGVSFTNGSSVTAKSGAAVTTYDATVTGITTKAY